MAKIAITQRVVEHDAYPERRDALSQEWAELFAKNFADFSLFPIPNDFEGKRVTAWLEVLDADAVILSGGNNWGDAPERDQTESEIIRFASSRSIPVLGVCRGLQVINKAFGGSIEPNICSSSGMSHTAVEHTVQIEFGIFSEIAGRNEICVNSFHDQGVRMNDLSPELEVFARAGDCVEGLFHPKLPMLGIQWHPERKGQSGTFDLELMRHLFVGGAFWLEKRNNAC